MIRLPHRPPRAGYADAAVPRMRGLSVAVLTAVLALAAHSAGGGTVPSASGIALILVVGAVAGWFAGPAVDRRRIPFRRSAVFAVLMAGQGAGHLLLSFVGGAHAATMGGGPMTQSAMGHGAMTHAALAAESQAHEMAAPGGPVAHAVHMVAALGPEMFAAHVAASLACAILVTAAESLYGPVARAFRRLVPAAPPVVTPVRRPVPRPAARPAACGSAVPVTPLTRRGPPRIPRFAVA
ncbi:hypothetical protein [Tomitella fengzijianii]|uniref:Uncharacterized protein n=1 Tax=Tomitella fengzijianii TaxID=2597660 RepID=A0A516WZM6_9ACTN|nr:hypothetical protein [Tomitella fengzijianii]QDQ96316.1 hypothetical protein FO059_01845 [Tomitella fengzijianii]